MALYRVTARLKPDTAAELRGRLDDGSIAAQQPDGQEMVDAFGRAAVTESGDVCWSETCYCPTPLAHERATVLDQFFDNLTTEPIKASPRYEGRPFLEYLGDMVERSSDRQT
jgi:hypothetical protein|tara:strand:+ start:150 stop:485 length:336 start_codon:yes stop_codon:yes gene_type:complete